MTSAQVVGLLLLFLVMTGCSRPVEADLCTVARNGTSIDGRVIHLRGVAAFHRHYAYVTDEACPNLIVEWNESEKFRGSPIAEDLDHAISQEQFSVGPEQNFRVDLIAKFHWRSVSEHPRAAITVHELRSFSPVPAIIRPDANLETTAPSQSPSPLPPP
jgi:hypothetical protein